MTQLENTVEIDDRLSRRLKHLNLILLAGVLVASIVLVSRLAGLVGETHEVLVSMSGDLKNVSTAAGNISRDVETLRVQVRDLQDKIDNVIPMEEVANAWRDTKLIKEGLMAENSSLPEKSRIEIEHLFESLTKAPYKYKRKGKVYSIAVLYSRVYAKYLSMRKTLTSSEDFIAKVGSQTMFGTDYIMVGADGAPTRLGDWFKEELKRIRESQE